MAAKRIEKLTTGQESLLVEWREHWLTYGCSGPADHARAEAAITKMYEKIGEKPPAFLWLDSPMSASLAIGVLGSLKSIKLEPPPEAEPVAKPKRQRRKKATAGAVDEPLESQLWSQLRSQLESQLESQLGSQLRSQLWSQLWSQLEEIRNELGERARKATNECWGIQQWGGYLAFLTFGREIGVKYPDEWSTVLDWFCEAAQNCGWMWPYKGLCVLSERPTSVGWENGRLHCATGPSVEFKDGWRLWHWRGTQVPEAWITAPDKLDPVTALNWENVEQRRCAAEIIGWKRVLEALPHKVINADKSPHIGTLLEVDLPGSPGSRFVKVLCGTGREFVLPVPPETKTALAGVAWTYNLKPSEYQLEART